MPRAGWILVALSSLLAVALVLGERVASDWVRSDAGRALLIQRAGAALGRDVAFAAVEVDVLPPMLRVTDLRVGGPPAAGSPGEPPALVEAPLVMARLAWLPLLRGVLLVDTVELREPIVRLVRTPRGWGLPELSGEVTDAARPTLAVRSVQLTGGRLEFTDRQSVPTGSLSLEEVDLNLAIAGAQQPIAFDLSAREAGGGQVRGGGSVGSPDLLDFALSLDNFPLGRLAGYMPVRVLEGRATGRVVCGGTLSAPEIRDADLAVTDGRLDVGGVRVEGSFALRAEQSRQAAGQLTLDAADAAVHIAGFTKPPGSPGRLRARVAADAAGWRFDDLSFEAGPLRGTGTAVFGEQGRADLEGRVVFEGGEVPVVLALRRGAAGGEHKTWDLELRASGEAVRVERLLAEFGRPDEVLLGDLDIEATLRGQLAGEGSLLDSLVGEVSVRIAPGEARGVSILRATLRSLDRLLVEGLLAHLPLPGRERSVVRTLESAHTDAFESLTATFRVKDGVAHTSDFVLVTPGYTFTMRGTIGLADLALDAVAQLRLGRGLASGLASALGLARLPLGNELVIPIPHLRGTLYDPAPEPDLSVLVRLVTDNLPGIREAGQLLRDLGEKVDPRR